jgi:pimeloyl-ACP methyl ester carboxylesterase
MAKLTIEKSTAHQVVAETVDQDRRKLLFGAAAIGLTTTAVASIISIDSARAATGGAIRPFHITVPEAALVDLRRRLAATRWPDKETVADDSQGVQLATLRQVIHYWQTDYNWRKIEARLNALPQFITEIDGLDIHFIHIRSKYENALPLVITHGWPGSIIEQLKIIDPLTDPTNFGGSAADAFHLVIPSIPGYGFSAKPTTTGWDPAHIARAWVVLMKRLGYQRFVAQGGDWGGHIANVMAQQAPPELIGIHVNFPETVPPEIGKALLLGMAPSGLAADEQRAFDQINLARAKHLSYAIAMATRPQTLYGIVDSPAGLAGWILDHDAKSYEMIAGVFDGHPAGLTRDDILDNITLYWLTNTGVSSARLYWENKDRLLSAVNVSIPAAVTVFPEEIYQAPHSWTQRAYHNLIYFNEADRGGHFAAWEQPQLFSVELRNAFRPLRQAS